MFSVIIKIDQMVILSLGKLNMTLDNLLIKDQQVTDSLRLKDDQPLLKGFAAFFAHSGDSWFWGAALLILWLVGSVIWRVQILLLFIGILITAGTVFVIKFAVRRPRPDGDWGQIYRRSDPHSFPSGHAARASMLTTIMFLSGNIWIGIVFLIWAVLVDLARIGLGVHYLSDIIGGTVIGILMGGLTIILF
jgi:undecaprenyl-diphosphatase